MFRKYPGNFWLLSASSFLFFSSFSMLIPELPAYLSRLGGEEYIGLIIALFTITAGISRPFSGRLTDRWGRIPVMIVGAIVSGVAALLYPLLITVPGFLLIRLFHGLSTGFKPTGTSAYVADIVPAQHRGEALGISSFFGTIGMASGPALGSLVYMNLGMNALFYSSSVFAFSSVILLVGMKETLPAPQRFRPGMLLIRFSDIFEPSVLFPSLIMVLTCASFGALITLTPDFSDHLHVGNRGIFFMVFTGSSLLVRIFGGRMSDRFGRKVVLKFSTSIIGISMIVIGFAETTTFFFVGAFIFGLGYGLNSPTLFAWTIDLTPEGTRGRGVATLYIFLEAGIGLGALAAGTFYQGMPDRFPIIFGSAGLFSFIAFVFLQLHHQK